MAYNSTTGSLHVGDLLNEDDEDTQVDFGYDSIAIIGCTFGFNNLISYSFINFFFSRCLLADKCLSYNVIYKRISLTRVH